MKQIELKQVSKRFGDVEVIPPIDLEIEEGEFVVFVGPSGCGKSTLLRLIAGLEDVTLGQILIDGQDATLTPPSISSCMSRPLATMRCLTRRSLSRVVGINFWPPKPGFTDINKMISTLSMT